MDFVRFREKVVIISRDCIFQGVVIRMGVVV